MIKPDTHFTIGADPEMFIINEKTRAVVSAIGLIPGEKGNPWRDPSWGPGFGIEIDNILVEYNIPPVDTKEDFIEVVNFMKDYIDRYLKRINPELGIMCASSMIVDKDQLDNPIAQLFGCCPDFNCYTGAPNPRPRGEKTNLRSAGFHVHYGYEHPSIDQSVEMVKYFDIFLGLMSLLFDTDRKRRSLYGKAGCYRLTSYGVEYRTLSSRMGDDDTTLGLIYDGVVAATQAYEIGLHLPNDEDVVSAINNSDVRAGKTVLAMLKQHVDKNTFIYSYLSNLLNMK